jgi:hypothetical protein
MSNATDIGGEVNSLIFRLEENKSTIHIQNREHL